MKRFLVLLSVVVLFFACEDGSYDYGFDRYYEEIVTFESKNVFYLDNGESLYNTRDFNQSYKTGERILLHYTLLEETTSGYDHTVRINGVGSVFNDTLRILQPEKLESLKKEPVRFESMWIGSFFLNMQFYMNFHSKAHSIALVAEESTLSEDSVVIHFIHDPNDDPAGAPVHLYASFNLKELLGEPQKNKNLRIYVNTSNYGEQIYDLVY